MLKPMRTPIRPTWFYSRTIIEDLDSISSELLSLFNESNKVFVSNHKHYFNVYWNPTVEKQIPVLSKKLKDIGILEKVERILFSNPENKSHGVIHVDSYNPIFVQFGLNFPVVHCKDSYIAFYEPIDNINCLKLASQHGPSVKDSHADATNYATIERENAKEITRFEMIEPVLVNTSQLHTGIITDKRRIIASMRFKPNNLPTESELESFGVINPFQQL